MKEKMSKDLQVFKYKILFVVKKLYFLVLENLYPLFCHSVSYTSLFFLYLFPTIRIIPCRDTPNM